MTKSLLRLALLCSCLIAPAALAQETAPAMVSGEPVETTTAAAFDTSYQASDSVAYTVRRRFLDNVRWSAGTTVRDQLTRAFSERAPADIWQELVATDGLAKGNVADALTAYWVLNWLTANGAYNRQIDNAPIQAQVRDAFANDPNFKGMNNRQRQEMAETYYLNFLVEHAALNDAVARRDMAALKAMAEAAVVRFRQQMGVNLLALEPGPEGFAPRPAAGTQR